MKNRTLLFFITLLFVGLFSQSSYACSSFKLQKKDNLVYGYNIDWYEIKGFVVINKRNIEKTAYLPGNESPATWISKYGSVSFNAFGKEFPFTGMNEAGLVISQMWLNETQFPETDDRSAISELQWIQYQLDNASTVQEVIASLNVIRISLKSIVPLHFLVCDRSANAAAIEFLEGKTVVHTGSDLPVEILTNSIYSQSITNLNQFRDTGDQTNLAEQNRFIRGATMISEYENNSEGPAVDYAFNILDNIKQYHTRWTFVYDIANQQIYYKTFRTNTIQTININTMDFDCDDTSMIKDIDDKNGELDTYSTEKNLELLIYNSKLYEGLSSIPIEHWQSVARYPESLHCAK